VLRCVAPRATASRNRCALRVQANWGAPVEFQPAKVLSNAVAAAGLNKLVLSVGLIASGYVVPGQYVQVKVGDSKPGEARFCSKSRPCAVRTSVAV
jgi:hypothetical protein